MARDQRFFLLVASSSPAGQAAVISGAKLMPWLTLRLFVHASPSFQAVASQLRGKPTTLPIPVDQTVVADVFKDFFLELGPDTPQTNESISRMEKIRGPRISSRDKLAYPTDWWNAKGKRIFGIPAPDPNVRVFELTERKKSIRVERFKSDCVVVQVSLNQSLNQALMEITKKLTPVKFSESNIHVDKPKYSLLDTPIRRVTMAMALKVLQLYQTDNEKYPLWWIGNQCAVTKSLSFTQEEFDAFTPKERAYRKKRLEIATSRVLRMGLLLAENAARGRFPCVDAFPEAQLTALKRKAGRPAMPVKRRQREIAHDPAFNAFSDADFSGLSATFGSRLPESIGVNSNKQKKKKTKIS